MVSTPPLRVTSTSLCLTPGMSAHSFSESLNSSISTSGRKKRPARVFSWPCTGCFSLVAISCSVILHSSFLRVLLFHGRLGRVHGDLTRLGGLRLGYLYGQHSRLVSGDRLVEVELIGQLDRTRKLTERSLAPVIAAGLRGGLAS